MADVIVSLIILAAVGAACRYIYKNKKQGECIGCPQAGSCSKKCH